MKWTDNDIKYLFDNYNLKSTLELSNILGRSVRSIKLKINRSGRSLNDIKWEDITCLKCDKKFKALINRKAIFCSKSCSAKVINVGRKNSEESKIKMSKIMKGRTSPFRQERPKCKICENECKKPYHKYCSRECCSKDPERKINSSIRMKKRFEKNPELHPNVLCAGIKESYPEKFLNDYFILNGLIENKDYIRQYNLSNYYIDFVFENINLAIEVDGERWHDPNCPKEIKREIIVRESFDLVRFKAKLLTNKKYTETIDLIIQRVKK